MIIVKLSGGLGNQMFQYALGKSVSIKTEQELKFDISFYSEQKFRKLELVNFIGQINIAGKEEIGKTLFPKNIFLKTASCLFKQAWKLSKNYIKEKKSFNFQEDIFLKKESCFFDGYWQNPKYFDDIREVLTKEMSIKNDSLDDYSKEVLDNMEKTNAVSIHIRAGDYLNIPEVRDICSRDYYLKAISMIKEKVINPTFFVFCEDENYSSQILPTNLEYIFVNTNVEKPYMDLFLMTKCKHNIIANSSFSWWGGWLNKNSEKLVICPRIWHNKYKEADIIPVAWTKI